MNTSPQRVAVIGASDNPDRYSYRATYLLLQHGHLVFPVNARPLQLPDLVTYQTIQEIPSPLHTVTLYVSPAILETLAEDIIAAAPNRVIFNPGTEHATVARRFRAAGVETIEACTLVMLANGRFTN